MVTEEMVSEKQASGWQESRAFGNSWLWWATAVLLLAAVLRLVALREIPPGLAQDEVLDADIASYIRQGANAFFFREGYGHEPLYHYWAVPFQALLGDNVLSIRLPAVFLGILLVALAMRWAKRSFDPVAAIAAGALLAVSWWPIVFSRIGIRPIMEPVVLLLFAWFWPRWPWLAGLFLGLSLYTYTGARVIVLWPLLLALYWLLFRKSIPVEKATLGGLSLPQPLLAAGIVLLVVGLVYLPLAVTLRADPTLQQRVDQLAGPITALEAGDPRPILGTALATLGVFSFTGDPRWTYMWPGRPLFDPLTAVFFYAGLLLALLRFKQPPYAFTLFWLAVGLLPSAITPEAPSTVRLVGAMPAVYTFPALAMAWLWRRSRGQVAGGKWQGGKVAEWQSGNVAEWQNGATAVAAGNQRDPQPEIRNPKSETSEGQDTEHWPLNTGQWTPARAATALLWAGIIALNLALTLTFGFSRWPQALETRLKYQTVLMDMADYLQREPGGSPVFADSFYRPITADSLRRDLGFDPRGRWVQSGAEVAGALVLPVEGNGRLYVPEYAAPDAWLMALTGADREPLFRSEGRPSFAVYELPAEHQLTLLPEPYHFEDNLSLVGYEITSPQDGQALQMVTAWQVNGELAGDLAIFVHWLDGKERLLSQHDGLDAAPETMRRGDLIIQRHVLPWGSTLPDPLGSLRLGLYRREDGRRLKILDGEETAADFVVIPLAKSTPDNSPGE